METLGRFRTGARFWPAALLVAASVGLPARADLAPPSTRDLSVEWPTLGYGKARTFHNPQEVKITKDNVRRLVLKWRWPTQEPVTASPAVVTVSVGGTPTRLVIVGTYDGTVYALRASSGLPLWQFQADQDRQVNYGIIVSSAAVADVALASGGAERRVFVGGGDTMYALDAATGALRWKFEAGVRNPSYHIETSPVVHAGRVYFGIDCNNWCDKGGFYALNADDGHLAFFFDLESGTVYRPGGTAPPLYRFDHKFDPSMYGPPGSMGCSSVWASPALDPVLGLLFVGSADCPRVPMPPYDEAVFALDLEGNPVWRWRPREIDQRDMDFGATPNAFVLPDGRRVVGAAGKDGAYYLLEAATGRLIWGTKLSTGGNFSGFYSGATDGRRIYLTSGIGEATDLFAVHEEGLRGRVFALDARTGNLVWRQYVGSPTVGQNSVIPGVYFTGGLDHLVHAYDTDTGELLWAAPVAGALSSTPVVVDGELFTGSGTGATYRAAVGCCIPFTPVAVPHPIPISQYGMGIYAFCLATEPGCAAERADVAA